jgi:hypothetical protein
MPSYLRNCHRTTEHGSVMQLQPHLVKQVVLADAKS